MAISKAIYNEAFELRQRKDQDYNSGGVGIDDYFPFKDQSYMHEINKKVLRLKSLIAAGHEPCNESIRDNLIDLVNYCVIYAEYLDHAQV